MYLIFLSRGTCIWRIHVHWDTAVAQSFREDVNACSATAGGRRQHVLGLTTGSVNVEGRHADPAVLLDFPDRLSAAIEDF